MRLFTLISVKFTLALKTTKMDTPSAEHGLRLRVAQDKSSSKI
jgi:hypothetical protein